MHRISNAVFYENCLQYAIEAKNVSVILKKYFTYSDLGPLFEVNKTLKQNDYIKSLVIFFSYHLCDSHFKISPPFHDDSFLVNRVKADWI